MPGKLVFVCLCVSAEEGTQVHALREEILTQHTNVQCCLVRAVVGDGPSSLIEQKETPSTC